uniref:NADH dehydrogenase (Ubiquinone) 1 beta subcomplex 3 n=1 Tax=Ceratosolen solmsi TaxID=142686 RepID=A0A0A1CM55_9HYME|nr:NADH dehydrogenase (ubiquinone) 1 beta subcomplex 3 [Ceratosolen solmsi]
MGKGHHQLPKIPDASVYKVENSVVLMNLQKKLAEKGLKDPWIRNHVWRFEDYNRSKYPKSILSSFFLQGYKYWIPLIGLTIAVESFLGIDYSGHGHGHEADSEH